MLLDISKEHRILDPKLGGGALLDLYVLESFCITGPHPVAALRTL
jgi:hypothetical protein